MNSARVSHGFILMVLIALILSCRGELKDQDGNILSTVKIGNQEWMAENLDVGHFRNGDTIPEVKTPEDWIRLGSEGKPAFRTDEDNPENNRKYGKLYNWYAVNDPRGLAPEGWHVASDEEWKQLTEYLGGEVATALYIRVTGYNEEGNVTSKSGFSGLPAGSCGGDGKFYGTGTNGYWWSATTFSPTTANVFQLNYLHCNTYMKDYYKAAGLSVRCIKD